jgi:uncharacterized glyoxalase superfamily protein PhnB
MPQVITPYLLCEDADAAVDFLARAFGFHEVDRRTGGAGGVHVEMEISPGGARIYLGPDRHQTGSRTLSRPSRMTSRPYSNSSAKS